MWYLYFQDRKEQKNLPDYTESTAPKDSILYSYWKEMLKYHTELRFFMYCNFPFQEFIILK
jgi:hypothetical protein